MSELIPITPDIKRRYPEAFAIARKSKFRIVWLEDDLVYVARRGRGHERYLVRFIVNSVTGRASVYCKTTTNGECFGCRFKEMCGHIAAVIVRWQKKQTNRREGKRAA